MCVVMTLPIAVHTACLVFLVQSAFNRQSLLVVSVSGSRGSVSVDAYQLMCPSCKGEREEVWLQPVMVIPASGLHSISRHLVQYAVMLRLTASFPVFFTMQSEGEVTIF